MNCTELFFRNHVYDFKAAVLKLTQQFEECVGRVAMEVVHEETAPVMLLQLTHHRLNDLFLFLHREVARIDVR